MPGLISDGLTAKFFAEPPSNGGWAAGCCVEWSELLVADRRFRRGEYHMECGVWSMRSWRSRCVGGGRGRRREMWVGGQGCGEGAAEERDIHCCLAVRKMSMYISIDPTNISGSMRLLFNFQLYSACGQEVVGCIFGRCRFSL